MLAINIDMHGSIMSHDLRLSQTNYRVSGSITVDDLAKIDKMNGRRICYFNAGSRSKIKILVKLTWQ